MLNCQHLYRLRTVLLNAPWVLFMVMGLQYMRCRESSDTSIERGHSWGRMLRHEGANQSTPDLGKLSPEALGP